jgi:hypothetical protein
MLLRILILRPLLIVVAAFAAPPVFAHPIDCTPGYSDSHCVTPLRGDAIPAPTCPSAPGYSTITPAVWAGYRWTQPVCSSYQAPPTCQPGYVETTAPSWNGASWVGLYCVPQAVKPDPPATCASAASSGSVLDAGLGYGRKYVAASQFAQYTPFFPMQWGGPYTTLRWPDYTLGDYQTNIISSAVSFLQLPLSTKNTNTWYAATYTGPSFQNDIGNLYNGYTTVCSIDASGNLAGIIQMPFAPSTSLDE